MRLPLPHLRSRSVPTDGLVHLSSSSPPPPTPPPPSPGAPPPLTSSPTKPSPSLPMSHSTRRERRERPSPPCPSPKLLSPSHALPPAALSAIAAALPARHRGKDLSLAYSTTRDGASLRTFYAAAAASCAEGDPIIIVVRDGGGSVFGAYLSRGDCRAPPGAKFFGSGECFVFTAAPEVAVYRWGRGNNFFQLAGKEAMSVGGGRGFALMLDESLEKGSSAQCDTFESPCLASSEAFECVVFEAWALVTTTGRSKSRQLEDAAAT